MSIYNYKLYELEDIDIRRLIARARNLDVNKEHKPLWGDAHRRVAKPIVNGEDGYEVWIYLDRPKGGYTINFYMQHYCQSPFYYQYGTEVIPEDVDDDTLSSKILESINQFVHEDVFDRWIAENGDKK